MTDAKVELGRHLFYDKRLSSNEQQACGSCHVQALAFTDGRPQAIGSTGERHRRSAMTLANVAYASTLTWADPVLTSLEEQARVPMFGEHPIELGLEPSGGTLVRRLKDIAPYRRLFAGAFRAESDPITVTNVTRALASFERTLVSGGSSYDRYNVGGRSDAISAEAKRGEQVFFSRRLSCFRCHSGFNFAGPVDLENRPAGSGEFHNTGLYNLAGELSYPPSDPGLYEITRRPGDVGRFKAPTLRNVGVTAPYMHDGSIATLAEVIDHYAAGGRTINGAPYQGLGHDNPNKSPLVAGFAITAAEKQDLIAFLESLTDADFLGDTTLADPWTPLQVKPE